MSIKYWLMKSEPETYSIAHLKKDTKTWWTGVRNYQARNFMMKEMSIGDEVLFYHSSAEPSGVAGLARICRTAEPDITQFDKKSDLFDPKATKETPIWFCVQLEFLKQFPKVVSLEEIRKEKVLKDMLVLKRGQRLSVQPVSEAEYKHIVKLAGG